MSEDTDPKTMADVMAQREASIKAASAAVEARRKDTIDALLADANDAHEALAKFIELDAQIQTEVSPYSASFVYVTVRFHEATLRAMLQADEKHAFIGYGVAMMRQAKQLVANPTHTQRFQSIRGGNWWFRLLRWLLAKTMPPKSEIVLRNFSHV
jgi:hypothetical protein